MSGVKRNSILVVFVSILLLSMALVAKPVYAASGNTSDTGFKFKFGPMSTNKGTLYREKNNTTRVYVRVTQKEVSGVEFMVYGSNKKSGVGAYNCTVNGSAYLPRKGRYHIRTNVHEWGYGYASLRAKIEIGPTGVLAGEWSPDSYGKYAVLN